MRERCITSHLTTACPGQSSIPTHHHVGEGAALEHRQGILSKISICLFKGQQHSVTAQLLSALTPCQIIRRTDNRSSRFPEVEHFTLKIGRGHSVFPRTDSLVRKNGYPCLLRHCNHRRGSRLLSSTQTNKQDKRIQSGDKLHFSETSGSATGYHFKGEALQIFGLGYIEQHGMVGALTMVSHQAQGAVAIHSSLGNRLFKSPCTGMV